MSTTTTAGKKRPLEDDDASKPAAAGTPNTSTKNQEDRMDVDAAEGASLVVADNSEHHYEATPFVGEHKRAVSSVQFAPSKLTKSTNSSYSANSNIHGNNKWNVLAASASADGTAKVWDLKPAVESYTAAAAASSQRATTTSTSTTSSSPHLLTPHVTCAGHARGINQVCWNPLSPLLATASDDKTLRVWDAISGDALLELRGHNSFVFSVDQSINMLVSGSFDETVKLWDLRSGECIQTLPAHSDPVTAVSFNRDGTLVASASHDGLIRLWDVATGECLKTLYAAGNPPVSAVKYTPSGKFLLAGTLDSTWRLWPVTQTSLRRCSKTYTGHHVNTKYSIVADFTANGKSVVTGSEDGNVVLYDLQTKKVQQVLEKAHDDAVLAVSAHDKLPLLCTGGMTNDRRVLFWGTKEYLKDD